MAEAEVTSPLAELEPRPVWERFDALRRVPRPSKKEERVVEHVRAWAREHGFDVRADRAGNLVVSVPASPGREAAPTVVLQAHLDMVCEKNAGVAHDFDRDPIEVELEGDWVTARGTTLGADNGLGVAAAMAAATDPEVEHGPLELLFTLDEETGLNGALALDPEIVTGGLLVNLDTEEDEAIYVGCAGAGGVEMHLPLERAPGGRERLVLAVTGLRGGHSGMDIVENRGNALKIAAQVLLGARARELDVGLVSLDGGSKANAIARECFCRLSLEAGVRTQLEEVLERERAAWAEELGTVDPDLSIELRRGGEDPGWEPLQAAHRDRLLRLVGAVPHGVLAMSREVPGLVETSNNLAIVATEKTSARLYCSFRSSVNAALTSTRRSLNALARLAGAEVNVHRGYPGWKPDPDAPLVRRTAAVYERLFGEPPGIKAVHAGLECGILVDKIPGLQAVSIGPEIRDPHSPFEKARVSSVAKFYPFLKALLAELAG